MPRAKGMEAEGIEHKAVRRGMYVSDPFQSVSPSIRLLTRPLSFVGLLTCSFAHTRTRMAQGWAAPVKVPSRPWASVAISGRPLPRLP